MRRARVLLAVGASALAACHATPPQAASNAREVPPAYRDSLVTYSVAKTYEDVGTVTTVSWYDADPSSRETSTTRFETHFTRGNQGDRDTGFRFEFHGDTPKSAPPRGAAWSAGGHTYRWLSSAGPPTEVASLDLATSSLAGPSDASSQRVPMLLFGHLPEVPTVQAGKEIVSGHDAFKFELTMPPREGVASETMTWWVDAQTHLIVRTFARVHLLASLSSHDLDSLPSGSRSSLGAAAGPIWVESTIEIEPIANAPLAPEALTFHPPL